MQRPYYIYKVLCLYNRDLVKIVFTKFVTIKKKLYSSVRFFFYILYHLSDLLRCVLVDEHVESSSYCRFKGRRCCYNTFCIMITSLQCVMYSNAYLEIEITWIPSMRVFEV
jgi:hypothetical protein